MATRTKEEERLLDEKIARIQKKNEEILRREKEIEEDKRLAAKQNAVVQLRSTSSNDSRERMPALRPSNRETGDSSDNYSKYSENTSPRGRETRRGRDRADRSVDGPPPDPRSYLADTERDPVPLSRDSRDEFQNTRGIREDRSSSRGGHEFQRGGRRGRGRPDRGKGRDEDAWRAERNRIDEERIRRQKASDGGWRREWDSEKLEQELDEEKFGGSRSGPSIRSDHWKSNYNQQYQCSKEFEFGSSNRGSRSIRSGRGRLDNNYNQRYLDETPSKEQYCKEMPRHAGHQHTEKSPLTSKPLLIRQIPNQLASEKTHFKEEVGIVRTIDNGTPKTILKYPTVSERSVIDVGGSFKILVPNTDTSLESAAASIKTPRRPNSDIRHRHKSQASYSSQSEDEAHVMSPREREYRGARNRGSKSYNKQDAAQYVKPEGNRKIVAPSYKPPLPSFESSQTVTEVNIQEINKVTEDGEGSWEDVTTSGTESMGEEVMSSHSSPNKDEINTVNKTTMDDIYTPEDFIIMQAYEDCVDLYSQGGVIDIESKENIAYIECVGHKESNTVDCNEDKNKVNKTVVNVSEQTDTSDVKSDKNRIIDNVENVEKLEQPGQSEVVTKIREDIEKAATANNTGNDDVKENKQDEETKDNSLTIFDTEHEIRSAVEEEKTKTNYAKE